MANSNSRKPASNNSRGNAPARGNNNSRGNAPARGNNNSRGNAPARGNNQNNGSGNYNNEMRGVLFHNNRKETDSHPDLTGRITIAGVDYWLSGWWNTSKQNMEYLSLSVRDTEPQNEHNPGNQGNDDLPY